MAEHVSSLQQNSLFLCVSHCLSLLWAAYVCFPFRLLHNSVVSFEVSASAQTHAFSSLGVYQCWSQVILCQYSASLFPKAVRHFPFPPVGSCLKAHVIWGISVPLAGNAWCNGASGVSGVSVMGLWVFTWQLTTRKPRPQARTRVRNTLQRQTRSWRDSNAGPTASTPQGCGDGLVRTLLEFGPTAPL